MDCFGDFCLSCDRQTNGTPFCSQACRLAELDHSTTSSEPTSPSYSQPSTSSQRPLAAVTGGFYLPPAIDFSSYRLSTSPKQKGRLRTNSLPRSNQQTSSTAASKQSSNLTPSSSQTSISSLAMNSSHHKRLSDQARTDLEGYASSFDQVRTLKRRISLL